MVSVIIPVFNEEKSLSSLFQSIYESLSEAKYDFEIIFVNDGSTDASAAVLDELEKSNSAFVRVVHLLRNYGQTAALSAGIDYSRFEIIVPLDADLQNDPTDIPLLVSKLNDGYDVVSGWRKDRKDSAIKRNFLSYVANFLIRKITKVKIHDLGCTLKAYRKEASWNGAFRITELPVKHHNRKHGASKYGTSRIIKVILDLIVVLFLHKYGQKPIYVFGMVGFLNLICSLLCTGGAIYYKFFAETYKSLIQTPLPLMASMFFVVGILCILLGLLAELSIRTYYESQNKKTYKIRSKNNI